MLVLLFLSVIILLLVWGSFIPQIQQVWLVKDTRTISSSYVLFTLFCATEHVFFSSSNMVYRLELVNLDPDLVNLDPKVFSISALDWVDFIQLFGIWVLLNVFFVQHLYYFCPTRRHRCLRILMVAFIYLFFLLITIIPLILDLTTDIFCPPRAPGDSHDCPLQERDIIPILRTIHAVFLLPIITIILPVLGFYKQAQRQRKLRPRSQQGQRHHEGTIPPPPPSTTPTSDLNLLLARPRLFQAAIFLLSALLWIFRVNHTLGQSSQPSIADPDPPYHKQKWLQLFFSWWMTIGYVAVDDAIFAIGQGLLGYSSMAARGNKNFDHENDDDAERRPLLGVHDELSA